MIQEWNIQSRANHCARTGKAFEEGEVFYTLLHEEGEGLRREDICAEAWKAAQATPAPAQGEPLVFWRSKFDPPPPPLVESVTKADAETHLRRLLAEGPPADKLGVVYLLAALLERKRIIKPVATGVDRADGPRVLPYEHAKSGEIFLVPDVPPRLDEIERLQGELASMLG